MRIFHIAFRIYEWGPTSGRQQKSSIAGALGLLCLFVGYTHSNQRENKKKTTILRDITHDKLYNILSAHSIRCSRISFSLLGWYHASIGIFSASTSVFRLPNEMQMAFYQSHLAIGWHAKIFHSNTEQSSSPSQRRWKMYLHQTSKCLRPMTSITSHWGHESYSCSKSHRLLEMPSQYCVLFTVHLFSFRTEWVRELTVSMLRTMPDLAPP